MMFGPVDWSRVFVPDAPLVEIFVRGTLIYLGIFVMLRIVLKREAAGLSMPDLLVVVLISDAAQNGMAGNYVSVPDGLVLVGTLIFWSHLLDWLAFRWPAFARLIEPRPLPLVVDGRMLRKNMKKELVTAEDLASQLRQHGIEDIAHVKRAWMEGDGQISVIHRDEEKSPPPRPQKQGSQGH